MVVSCCVRVPQLCWTVHYELQRAALEGGWNLVEARAGHADSLKRTRRAGEGGPDLARQKQCPPPDSRGPFRRSPGSAITWPRACELRKLGLFQQHLGLAHRPGGGTIRRCYLDRELAGGGELTAARPLTSGQLWLPHGEAEAVITGWVR